MIKNALVINTRPTKNSIRTMRSIALLSYLLILVMQTAVAQPYGVFDARTMAMGGVGVASGSQFAAFNNPALLTTADEIHEWFLLAPTLSKQLSDPNNVEDTLTEFQQAADAIDISNTAGNRAKAQQALDALDGNQYSTSSNAALMLAIPSRILSGAAFFNVYEVSSAQPVIGGDDLTIPSYASSMKQRGLRIAENGVSAATILQVEKGWLRNVAVGLNAKFLLIEGYGYSEPLRSAEVDIKKNNSKNSSQFAVDLGLLKEFGVWKMGLVAKNVLPGNYKYGSSSDKFTLDPQLRAGFAYQSRRSVVELDIDLVSYEAAGLESTAQIAALGWEWKVWQWLALRAGFNKNMQGTKAAYGSIGLGLAISSLQIDAAAYRGEEGEGISAQLGLQF